METIIVGKNLRKTFGLEQEKVVALDDVSAQIDAGEFVAVMGPSGSGKSTLLYAMSGMDSVDSGNVLFDGQELTGLDEPELAEVRRKKMGFIFQQPTFLRNLNILDNIILPVMVKTKNADKTVAQARKMMADTGISELENREVTQVSGGQLQRAGICRALINEPMILFGDEPTGALNSKTSGEIMDLLSEINATGTAILLVTHDAKVAARADRVLFMLDGRINAELQFSEEAQPDPAAREVKILAKMHESGI